MWKHEGFGQYYVMGWAAGHKLRLSGDDSVVKEVVCPAKSIDSPLNFASLEQAMGH